MGFAIRLYSFILLTYVEFHLAILFFPPDIHGQWAYLYIFIFMLFTYFSRDGLMYLYQKEYRKHHIKSGFFIIDKPLNFSIASVLSIAILFLLWGFHFIFGFSAWITAKDIVESQAKNAAATSAPYLLAQKNRDYIHDLYTNELALHNFQTLQQDASKYSQLKADVDRLTAEKAQELVQFINQKKNGIKYATLAKISVINCTPSTTYRTFGAEVCGEYEKLFDVKAIREAQQLLDQSLSAKIALDKIMSLREQLNTAETKLIKTQHNDVATPFEGIVKTVQFAYSIIPYTFAFFQIDVPAKIPLADEELVTLAICIVLLLFYAVALILLSDLHAEGSSYRAMRQVDISVAPPTPIKIELPGVAIPRFSFATPVAPSVASLQQGVAHGVAPVAQGVALFEQSFAQGVASVARGYFDVKIGVAADGTDVIFNPITSPHSLIVGATRAGKSAAIAYSILPQLIEQNPTGLTLHLMDGKGSDLMQFQDIPQVATLSATPQQCNRVLRNIVQELKQRNESLLQQGFVNLREAKENAEESPPHVLLIIDELTAIVASVNPDYRAICAENMGYLEEIAQRGASSGFHLLIGTQSPLREYLPPALSINLISRIAFRLSNRQQYAIALSRTENELAQIIQPDTFRPYHGIFSDNGHIRPFQSVLHVNSDYKSRSEWITARAQKRQIPNITELRVAYQNGQSMRELARQNGVNASTISRMLRKTTGQ